jgi:type II secretory pathway pseudopilin PulG
MKKLVNLTNESGFGLIHVLAVTMIVSIATLGLFMSIEYAKAQADMNYHSRRALLMAQGQLEKIKYENRNLGTYGRPSIVPYSTTINLDDDNSRYVTATLTISSTTGGNPEAVTGLRDTFRDEVYVDITWQEKKTADPGMASPEEQRIHLQEDYYWKLSTVSRNR